MPQNSVLYAMGRISSLEDKLIDTAKLERMLQAPTPMESLWVLTEAGYGAPATAQAPQDYERLIENELAETGKLIHEITPDEAVTDLFMMRYDYANAKALFKMRLSGKREPDALSALGRIPTEALDDAIEGKGGAEVPDHLAEAVAEVEQYLAQGRDPARIDAILDRAYVSWAAKAAARVRKPPMIRAYFQDQADLYNLVALIRLRRMGGQAEQLRGCLAQGGKVKPELISECFSLPPEQVAERLKEHFDDRVLDEVVQGLTTGSTWQLERTTDNRLMELARRGKTEIFTIGPILGFLLAREAEARAIRLIMVGKMNGLPQEKIRERLREMYV